MSEQIYGVSEVGPDRPKRPKTGGRQVGTPNRITADVRRAIAALAENNTDRVQRWLDRVAEQNPAEALRIWLQLLEFTMPKLRAATVDVRDGVPRPVGQLSLAELQAIVVGTGEPVRPK